MRDGWVNVKLGSIGDGEVAVDDLVMHVLEANLKDFCCDI